MLNKDIEPDAQVSEREKWETDAAFREREISLKEKEHEYRGAELELKRQEQASSGWRNPLVVAILAATIAASGNAVVTVVNGSLQRRLENEKSEQARILEMIKTGDPDKAAKNLEFLLEAGLISHPQIQTELRNYLANRKPGSGPTLPTPSGSLVGGITGIDEAIDVDHIASSNNVLKKASVSVGQVKAITDTGQATFCTAFLVGDELALTAGYCAEAITSATLSLRDQNTELSYKISLPPLEIVSQPEGVNYALLRVEGKPGAKHGTLTLASEAPAKDQPLMLVFFRGDNRQLAITGSPDCRVLSVEQEIFRHLCDTGAGSSGSPILTVEGKVVGMHIGRSDKGGKGLRSDILLNASGTLWGLK